MPRAKKNEVLTLTRGDILREFLRRSDVIRSAQEQGLLDHEEVIRMIDGYRQNAAEKELQAMILTQEEMNHKRKEAEKAWEQLAKAALAEINSGA